MNNGLKHIAIIMDGNGRWAKERGMLRTSGHQKGAETVREITRFCADLKGLERLTLYAFSTENWKRPKTEVEFLMNLLKKYLKNEINVYLENGVRFDTIGDMSAFSNGLKEAIEEAKEKTSKCNKITQVLALNYGSRDEIRRAFEQIALKKLPITEQNISNYLDSNTDVDMLIRTGGEKRLSNYLLWQSAYAELFFTDTYWPDFTTDELTSMIDDFYGRERRFGGV